MQPNPDDVQAAYKVLFGGVFDDVDDVDLWLDKLQERIAVVEAALEAARMQRAQIVAHLRTTFGRSCTQIAQAHGGLSPQRVSQLAAKGRLGIVPLTVASVDWSMGTYEAGSRHSAAPGSLRRAS